MSADLRNTNNPFRRKGGNPANATPAPTTTQTLTPSPPTASTQSHDAIPAAVAAAPAPRPAERKTKPVKRVRVQTPPPLSSDSESESDSPVDRQSPFGTRRDAARGPFRDEEDPAGESPAQPGPPHRNPFSTTLQDIEPRQHRDEPKSPARIPGRASLDVEAFRRLLLTGQSAATTLGSSPPNAATPSSTTSDLSATAEPASSASRRPLREPAGILGVEALSSEARRDTRKPESYEGPTHARTDSPVPAPQKRKPPPPSSRHGKAIQLGHDRPPAGHAAPPTPPLARVHSDLSKPLPLAPIRTPSDEDAESIFDREAAGRVPESSAPPSPAASVNEAPGPHRRPTPAPPPRRSRTDGVPAVPSTPPAYASEPPQRRMSAESTHSRTDSIRHSAPVPPPRRRPGPAHRSTPSATSLSAFSPPTTTSPGPPAPHPAAASPGPTSPRGQPAPSPGTTPKHVPPPPPPTRNASMRRKSSISSSEGGARRTGAKGGEAAPPPPPRRLRGSSRGSVDLAAEPSRRTAEGTGGAAGVGTVREVDEGRAAEGAAEVILADLGALQREVEELQKRYASAASQPGG